MNIIHLLYMDRTNKLDNIKKIYEKLSYFDQFVEKSNYNTCLD
jgi:hypothetical protein